MILQSEHVEESLHWPPSYGTSQNSNKHHIHGLNIHILVNTYSATQTVNSNLKYQYLFGFCYPMLDHISSSMVEWSIIAERL